MLATDVRLEGFTATDWTRLLSLFQPRRASGMERDPDRPRGGVVAIHAGGRLRKLVHTQVGRLQRSEAGSSLAAVDLAERHHASWALSMEAGTLERIMDCFGARTRRGDDITAQSITVLELAREELLAGKIDLWPHRLRGVPIPAPIMVTRSLDSVCTVGRTLLIGLFDEGELWTSVAMRRGESGFNLILGPDEIRHDMGLLSGSFRRDYRHLARAIEERVGPLALGCFAEASTIRKLGVDPSPGAWAKAAALRDLILSPFPMPLAIPLGVDAGRAAFTTLRAIAERVDPIGVVAPTLQALRDLTTGARDMESVLGFHPLDLLRRLLSREH